MIRSLLYVVKTIIIIYLNSLLVVNVATAETDLLAKSDESIAIADMFKVEVPASHFGYYYGFAVALPLVLVAIGGLTIPTALMMMFIYSWKFLLPGEV
jgi:hypothetical protein